jgi:4'-phosphopantetheinyl transferase
MAIMSRPGVDVWLATPEAAAAFNPLLLRESQRREWAALRTPRRRLDFAASRLLLNTVPGIEARPHSLSHSHAWAAVAAAAPGMAVGVDIEWLRPRRFCSMAEVAFPQEESAYLASIPDKDRCMAVFYELWTLKEACAKAFGLHFLDALRTCRFIGTGLDWEAALPVDAEWRARLYAPRPELRLAVVWTLPAGVAEPVPFTAHELDAAESAQWPLVRCLGGPAASAVPGGDRTVHRPVSVCP